MLVGWFDHHKTNLQVDTWKVSHNQDGSLTETFDGKTDVKHIEDIIYLGVVVSSDGKNTKNIIHKRNRALAHRNRSCIW